MMRSLLDIPFDMMRHPRDSMRHPLDIMRHLLDIMRHPHIMATRLIFVLKPLR